MTFSGWIATLAGWYVTEIGRQPFMVSGLVKIEELVTNVPSEHVLLTLIGYLTLYAVLLAAYIKTLFYTARNAVQVEEYQTAQVQGGQYV
jgi:cytochrome d ubiquinol oxidase subunit I